MIVYRWAQDLPHKLKTEWIEWNFGFSILPHRQECLPHSHVSLPHTSKTRHRRAFLTIFTSNFEGNYWGWSFRRKGFPAQALIITSNLDLRPFLYSRLSNKGRGCTSFVLEKIDHPERYLTPPPNYHFFVFEFSKMLISLNSCTFQ